MATQRAKSPTARQFTFRSRGDGEYWFSSRTLDGSQQTGSQGPLQAELRVFVDTASPQIELAVRTGQGGKCSRIGKRPIRTCWPARSRSSTRKKRPSRGSLSPSNCPAMMWCEPRIKARQRGTRRRAPPRSTCEPKCATGPGIWRSPIGVCSCRCNLRRVRKRVPMVRAARPIRSRVWVSRVKVRWPGRVTM